MNFCSLYSTNLILVLKLLSNLWSQTSTEMMRLSQQNSCLYRMWTHLCIPVFNHISANELEAIKHNDLSKIFLMLSVSLMSMIVGTHCQYSVHRQWPAYPQCLIICLIWLLLEVNCQISDALNDTCTYSTRWCVWSGCYYKRTLRSQTGIQQFVDCYGTICYNAYK